VQTYANTLCQLQQTYTVRKKLGNSPLLERVSAVAANETREILLNMSDREADIAAAVHSGPTTPITGGVMGRTMVSAPLSASCQSH
jgi:hypothetical protein